jgi:nucleotide-binding universal stress UspA family protein
MNFKKILCAVDEGPLARAVFQTALTLSKELKGELALVTIIDLGIPGEAIDIETFRSSLRAEASDLFQRLVETGGEPNVYKFIEEGDPKSKIVEVARQWEADMIVMASHGRKGLTRLLMGSVAEAVLRSSKCPVLVVPAPK